MTMLADHVDVVIGVDTHKHTHTAVVVAAVTGAALETVTVPTDVKGYQHLVEFADRHPGARVWAIEGTGTYGAGLTRHLHTCGEEVLELDRPKRPARRNGAKTDSLDARCVPPATRWPWSTTRRPAMAVIALACRC